METILLSAAAFAGTNIDDLFISIFFFAGASGKKENRSIIFGKYAGILLLTLLSMLGAGGLQLLPLQWIRLLGLVPVWLGARAILRALRKTPAEESPASSAHTLWLNVMLVSIANGADNIGVYIPLFAGFQPHQMLAALCVFLIMNGLWCFAAKRLTDLPVLKQRIVRYQPVLVPAVYLLLGLYILL